MNPGPLPVLDDFAAASGHGERADMLLRMPIALAAREHLALAATCRATGFAAGADYVHVLAAVAHARRDGDGEVPEHLRGQLAAAGRPLVEMAEAWRPVTDDDGICRRGEFEPGRPMPASADDQPDTPARNPLCACPPVRSVRDKCPHWRWKHEHQTR